MDIDIYGLLLHPDTDDPLDAMLATRAHTDPVEYRNAVAAYTEKHATARSRRDIKLEFDGEDEGGSSSQQY